MTYTVSQLLFLHDKVEEDLKKHARLVAKAKSGIAITRSFGTSAQLEAITASSKRIEERYRLLLRARTKLKKLFSEIDGKPEVRL